MRILKKIIFTILKFVFVFFLSIFVILVCFENKIYTIILDHINNNINTEISSRQTKLSLFKYFPNAALTFYDVKVNFNKSFSLLKADTINANKCISARELTIIINIFQILKNQMVIKRIDIKNGSVTAIENLHGIKNYLFDSNLSKNSNALIFQIQKITLKNVDFKYFLEKTDLYINSNIKNLIISGKLQKDNSKFKVYTSLNQLIVSSTKTHLLWNYVSDISFNFSLKNELISITEGEYHSLNEKIKFKGNVFCSKPAKYDFIIASQLMNIANFKKYNIQIPKEITSLKGDFSLYMNIYGKDDVKSSVNIYLFLLLKNLSFNYNNYKLNNINCKLFFKGKLNSTYKGSITVETINGKLFNSNFDIFNLKYENINDSIIGNGSLIVKYYDLKNFIKDTSIDFNSGEIKWSFSLKSKMSNTKYLRFNNLFENSSISLKNLSFSFLKNKYQVSNLNSKIITSTKSIKITYLDAIINNNKFLFKGNINNYLSFFKDSLNNIEINGKLSSKYLNLENLITNNRTNSNDNLFLFKISPHNVTINVNIDTIVFKKISLTNYYSLLLYSNNNILIKNIYSTFCEGKVLNGTVILNIEPNLIDLTSSFSYKKINIEKLFTTFNDFGQKEITSRNIKGQLNGTTNCKILWKNNNFSKDDLQGSIDFEVLNGELNGFTPIYKLSKFVALSELNNIKFKKIANKILITNKLVIIPYMNINSSVLNLSLSGYHSFENKYEYHFKVILSDLLYGKQSSEKKEDFDFFQTEDDTLHRIYIKLQGDCGTYKFTYDSKLALKTFSNKIEIEKYQFKKIFNEEYGLFKNDTSFEIKPDNSENKTIIESEDIKPKENQNQNQIEIDKKNKKKKSQNKIEWKDN